jgi:hypothetical protein
MCGFTLGNPIPSLLQVFAPSENAVQKLPSHDIS